MLHKLVKEAGIDPDIRHRYAAAIKSIVTPKQLEDFLPGFRVRLQEGFENQELKKIDKSVSKLVKKAVSKGTDGKQMVDMERYLRNLRAIQTGKAEGLYDNVTDLQPLATKLVQGEGLDLPTATLALDSLTEAIKDSRGLRKEIVREREAEYDRLRRLVKKGLGPSDLIAQDYKDTSSFGVQAGKALIREHLWMRANADWQAVLQGLLGKADDATYHAVREELDILQEEIKTQHEKLKTMVSETTIVKQILIDRFGYHPKDAEKEVANYHSYIHQARNKKNFVTIRENAEVTVGGEVQNRDIVLNKNELRYIYHILQNNDLRPRIIGPDGGLGWPSDLVVEENGEFVAAPELSQHFNELDYAIIEAHTQIYDTLYDQVNQIYEHRYGVPLGIHEFYRPITTIDQEPVSYTHLTLPTILLV